MGGIHRLLLLVPEPEGISVRRIPAMMVSCMLFAAALAAGCTDPAAVLVDEGRSYTFDSATDLLTAVEPDEAVVEDPSPERRSAALTALRRDGATGNQAADLITRAFPPGSRGVPFYVEKAIVGDEQVWLVIEAIGPAGRPADDERLWILSADGDVLFSATR